ncbi:DUF4394 domain-containing protein [Pelagibacterium luteolum]|uniref:DUF4394 domain-containing protein n=1 Tax=Pelagibacterium luteolum TaxID=440168 RepID=A0A1G7WEE2_9HYPH|nr:DUF4394 domain-containing protein [Pelagibacterium luteolum]SDG69530.1 protein of unknown function [Pelagibacterium luteolum]
MTYRVFAQAALVGTSFLALSGAALAQSAVGLAGDKTLVMIDTESLAVEGMMEVSGVDTLWGIDQRPADNMLYGVDQDYNIVTIDLESGEATVVSTITETIGGDYSMVDFNPVADRLRFMGSDGTNLRINVDTGETTVDGDLNFAEGDEMAGMDFTVVATAYTNSVGAPEATAMYDIEWNNLALLQQTAPNDGTLETRGMLGVDSVDGIAFDIFAEEIDANTAYLVANMTLHTVDLESGAATEVGPIEGLDVVLRDIAFLHEGM